ncbi:MAG TPA: ABC transporter ATP-binding protein [Acidimicrobiales bacterium]|nr:ABC transporter ATP-binding protein [Acidimicrobiales bacterium]
MTVSPGASPTGPGLAGPAAPAAAPATPASPLLVVESLTVALRTSRGIRRAVDGISFSIGRGEILGIAGESGSGKTLTALSLLGLLPMGARTSGSVRFEGRELLGLKKRELRDVRGRQVALVSQDPATALHPLLRIDVQMTEHVRAHLGLSKEQADERAIEMLTAVRIPDPGSALFSYPHQFSGGMRQRIAIAMALACEPRLLIADEPTTALDVTVQAGILRLLDRLRRERGVSVMIITHDLGVMSSIADRICVLYGGRVAEYGATPDVLGGPRHPYTYGLMQSLPSASAAGAAMVPIQGAPPSLDAMPAGCAFHPRCEWAEERCRTVVPTLRALDDGRRLACDVDPLVEHERPLAGAPVTQS